MTVAVVSSSSSLQACDKKQAAKAFGKKIMGRTLKQLLKVNSTLTLKDVRKILVEAKRDTYVTNNDKIKRVINVLTSSSENTYLILKVDIKNQKFNFFYMIRQPITGWPSPEDRPSDTFEETSKEESFIYTPPEQYREIEEPGSPKEKWCLCSVKKPKEKETQVEPIPIDPWCVLNFVPKSPAPVVEKPIDTKPPAKKEQGIISSVVNLFWN